MGNEVVLIDHLYVYYTIKLWYTHSNRSLCNFKICYFARWL